MEDAPAYAESLYPRWNWDGRRSMRGGRRDSSSSRHRIPSCTTFGTDPSETTNRIGEQPARAASCARRLEAAMRQRPPSAAAAVVDPTTMERLRALGYVSGRGRTAPRDGVLSDPKDGVHLLPPLNRGMSAARDGPGARHSRADRGARTKPRSSMARRTRAVAFTAAGRHELAIADLRAAREGRAAHGRRRGGARRQPAVRPGRRPRLRRSWSGSRARTRNSHSRLLSLADLRIQEGKHADAAASCERVLTIASPIRSRRSDASATSRWCAGDVQAAGLRYSRILALDAADVPAMIKLGIVSIRSGRAEEATRLFQQAIALEPNNAEALLYLAGALASGGTSRGSVAVLRTRAQGRPAVDDGLERVGADASRRRRWRRGCRRVPRVAQARSGAGGGPQDARGSAIERRGPLTSPGPSVRHKPPISSVSCTNSSSGTRCGTWPSGS